MPRLKPTPKEINLHVAQLADTPTTIRKIIASLSADDLKWSPSPKDWSVVEVLAHLRACADAWSYSIYAMLTENQPVVPLIDERRWAKTLGYATLSFEESMNVFTIQREDLLRVLRSLDTEQWERTCQIVGRNHSVFSQTRRMALHEVEHYQQFQALVDKIKTKEQS
jgi:hypothetical protein